jgi:hypothetical protein
VHAVRSTADGADSPRERSLTRITPTQAVDQARCVQLLQLVDLCDRALDYFCVTSLLSAVFTF